MCNVITFNLPSFTDPFQITLIVCSLGFILLPKTFMNILLTSQPRWWRQPLPRSWQIPDFFNIMFFFTNLYIIPQLAKETSFVGSYESDYEIEMSSHTANWIFSRSINFWNVLETSIVLPNIPTRVRTLMSSQLKRYLFFPPCFATCVKEIHRKSLRRLWVTVSSYVICGFLQSGILQIKEPRKFSLPLR